MEALASATGLTSEVRDVSGTATGILKIETAHGVVSCTVDEFGDAYRGMVRIWPAVAKVRDAQDGKRKVQADSAREAAKLAKLQAVEQAKADKAAAALVVKQERDAAKAKDITARAEAKLAALKAATETAQAKLANAATAKPAKTSKAPKAPKVPATK